MKNFAMRCPIDGTSALQPQFDRAPAQAGTIIAFPRQHASDGVLRARARVSAASETRNCDMVWSLRNGTARGCAYDRVAPWQAVVAGTVLTALSIASLFIGL